MSKGKITTATRPQTSASDTSIRPFQVGVPEEQLTDLRRRIAATRWPERACLRHTHPGEGIIYVLERSLEYEIAGQPRATYKPVTSYLFRRKRSTP